MKLSIIIVNYNVRYFLSSCLQSVEKAIKDLDAEVIVVDNNSNDHSVELVHAQFPKVKVIANQDNRGFSYANNQGIDVAQGEYILLLNPDTIVEEECFRKCLVYMDTHPKVGGLGVRMIDGSGQFLPESKRGLPTPAVAFYKIFGLARLFPESKRFGAYHLGYLSAEETNEVDVLSGAYMFLRKSVLDQIGGLDEAFFMYGEDIDLSYRITQAGFKNVYFADTRIIHFKGESTKKSSVNYVLVFYRAMIIFAKKHFSYPNARLLSFLIHSAIYFRASIALFNRIARLIYMPIIDALILLLFLNELKNFYEYLVAGHPGYLPDDVIQYAFPAMVAVWIGGQFLTGGYRQPVKRTDILKGLVVSAVVLFIGYAMLNESLRFSRGIVGLAVFGSFILIPVIRLLLQRIKLFRFERSAETRTGIVGSEAGVDRIRRILNESSEKSKKLFYIHPERKNNIDTKNDLPYTCSLYQLKDMTKVYRLDEVIFCMSDISATALIAEMQQTYMHHINMYLCPPEGNYMLRSSSNKDLGEYIVPEVDPTLNNWANKKKRAFEIFLAILLLVLSPVIFYLFRRPGKFLRNMAGILTGRIRLIEVRAKNPGAPALIRPFQTNNTGHDEFNPEVINYLVHYSIQKDLGIVLSNLVMLDGNAS